MSLLEMTFLVQTIPAWTSNLGKRLVRTPKLMLCDTGLMAHLIGADPERLRADTTLAGGFLENFVTMELRKQITWSRRRPRIHHYRTQTGDEVDLVLEDASGRIVGIEIKMGKTSTAAHFKGLRTLAAQAGESFVRGIVLYGGSDVIPYDRNMHALPIDALWTI
jgi:uncharacterized protein